MPTTVTVVGLSELRGTLGYLGKETPYALSVALNNLAVGTKDYLTGTMDLYIDRPNPFTRQALGVKFAKKTELQSRVFVKPQQLSYLIWQIEGGIEYPPGRALVVPWKAKRDRYGNMPGDYIRDLLGTHGVFSGTVRGVPGIWQRWTETWSQGGTFNIGVSHLQLIVAYERKAKYTPRWPILTQGVDWAGLRINIEAAQAAEWVLSKAP